MSPILESRVVTERMREHPDSHTWERYRATGGYEALGKVLADNTPEEVTELVKSSGLRGRGGAGFPTGTKWEFIPKDVFPRYVVINNDEGEPCTFKDRELTERDPHAVIEGALIAAYAVQAVAVYIYVRGEFALAHRRLDRAIADARGHGLIGSDILGSGFSCEVFTHPGAGAYICGEETALLESLEGLRGQPRLRPPFFPAIKGLYNQPTVVNNSETVASLPKIINKGVDWWRGMGTEKSPGTRIFSLSTGIERPGNYELSLGVQLTDLLELGGGISGGRRFKAVIFGASAPWLVDPSISLDFEAPAEAGSMLGSGSVIVLDESSCAVETALITARFFNHESCGKCTPCREGTWWQSKILERVERGEGRDDDLEVLVDVSDNMSAPELPYAPKGQCFCPLGDGAAWSVRSAVQLFKDEFVQHIEDGACPFKQEAS